MSVSPICEVTYAAFDAIMPSIRGRSVVDVGANEGVFVRTFLEHEPRRVVAIEPGPRLSAALEASFGADSRVVVRRQGLSSEAGRLEGVRFHNCWTLARPGEFKGRLAAVSPGAAEFEGNSVFDVELTTLDNVVADEDLSDLAFVKIDVDGYEDRVLRGGEQTIRTFRPAIMIELSYLIQDVGDDVEAMLQRIASCDYVLATMGGRTCTMDQVRMGYPWHTSFDVMMLPRERTTHLPAL